MADDNSDSKVTLSRRKALAGIGSIGLAGALGVGGTYAQFTDTESDSVTFSAGGIDGTIRYGASYNSNDVKSFGSEGFEPNGTVKNVTVDEHSDGIGLDFEFTDIKPGDYGCFSFGIEVQNNPAWVAACLGYENDTDGQVWEPEVSEDGDLEFASDGTTVQTTGNNPQTVGTYDPSQSGPIAEDAMTNGEIPHNMLLIPFYGGAMPPSEPYDPCVFFDEENETFDHTQYTGSGANSTPSQFWDNATGSLTPATLLDILQDTYVDTAVWGDGDTPAEVDIVNAPGVAEGCVFLNGELSNENEKEAAPIEPGTEFRFGWDWHVPFDTGNEMQGDKMNLKLGFTFSQVRHTESAELNNIYAPGQNTPNGS
jgi:predicted ribosomally synthesized peptide with SipW-like signal peptide